MTATIRKFWYLLVGSILVSFLITIPVFYVAQIVAQHYGVLAGAAVLWVSIFVSNLMSQKGARHVAGRMWRTT